ncbi:MAG: UDP-2,3-diacylglucosamine diphosphatase [Thermoguttaceae bacterium]|jgi:UDP-2,3-diacylglucosamine pyrophosphatase LpxH
MTRFCISDLHLCDKGPRDNFAFNGRGERFCEFLNFVGNQGGKLLILGDLFDWWQVNLSESVLCYRWLIDRLAAMQARYVIGNHDNALAKFIGASLMPAHPLLQLSTGPFEETIGGRKFAFLHGHEADPYCNSLNPGVGEITAVISGVLEDRNKGPFNAHGHAIEDEFVGTLESVLTLWRRLTFQHGRLDEMIDQVEAHRTERQADVVVYGHTHEPGRIGDRHYNTGCWCRSKDTFLCIEDDGAVSLWEWTEAGAVPFNRTLR